MQNELNDLAIRAELCRMELQVTPLNELVGEKLGKVCAAYEVEAEALRRENQMLRLAITTLQGQVAALTPKPPVFKSPWWSI